MRHFLLGLVLVMVAAGCTSADPEVTTATSSSAVQDQTTPVIETEPVVPPEPADVVTPAQDDTEDAVADSAAEPAEATEPTEPTEPAEATEPTEPAEPTEAPAAEAEAEVEVEPADESPPDPPPTVDSPPPPAVETPADETPTAPPVPVDPPPPGTTTDDDSTDPALDPPPTVAPPAEDPAAEDPAAEDPPAEDPAADDPAVDSTSTPTTEDEEDTPQSLPTQMLVMEWNDIGGCEVIGLCPRRAIYDDGSVEVMVGDRGLVSTGTVDVALVRAVLDAADVDASTVLATAGPGPCRRALDGIDIELAIRANKLLANTCDFDLFNADHPLLAAARTAGQAAAAAAPVDRDALFDN